MASVSLTTKLWGLKIPRSAQTHAVLLVVGTHGFPNRGLTPDAARAHFFPRTEFSWPRAWPRLLAMGSGDSNDDLNLSVSYIISRKGAPTHRSSCLCWFPSTGPRALIPDLLWSYYLREDEGRDSSHRVFHREEVFTKEFRVILGLGISSLSSCLPSVQFLELSLATHTAFSLLALE